MSAFDLTACMDGIGDLIAAANLVPNVYRWPPEAVTVPCAIVGYPTTIELGATFARGTDSIDIPLWLVVGKTTTQSARDALSVLLGTAPAVKSALDGSHSYGDFSVNTAEVTTVTISGVDYLGLKFTVDVFS